MSRPRWQEQQYSCNQMHPITTSGRVRVRRRSKKQLRCTIQANQWLFLLREAIVVSFGCESLQPVFPALLSSQTHCARVRRAKKSGWTFQPMLIYLCKPACKLAMHAFMDLNVVSCSVGVVNIFRIAAELAQLAQPTLVMRNGDIAPKGCRVPQISVREREHRGV